MTYENIREEELKNKIAQDYFWLLDCTKIVGNVDFCVSLHHSQNELFDLAPLLWAEAKKGIADIQKSISQLVLTIGKARTFDKSLPPAYLGAFDAEKIAFVPYSEISDIFYQNDFNWNVAPSNHDTREFKLIQEKVKNSLDTQALIFDYEKDNKELRNFIQHNFIAGKYGITKTRIDKNNFMVIYNKWLSTVKPTINVNWEIAKKMGIIDGDFYLADLLSQENETLKDKLYVLLKKDQYQLDRKLNEAGMFSSQSTGFNDKQKAHTQFWNKYERPPKEEYWDYIVGRRDLLVPQDVRERKGSFFTPQIWVELSQKYLADTLGEDWQDEYYIWDCACGTGNLLAGLTNKNNIFASTLDKQDVDVMHDRIKNGANLWENQVFQFDFLNDDFTKLPKSLQEIINNPEKQKKLLIYINPPYAEASSRATVVGKGENKSNVATETKVYQDFHNTIGTAARELFTQFLIRIVTKIPDGKIAQFSTLKMIQAPNFFKFRSFFKAEFQKGFLVPADTFDNVGGKFPIGFFIWDLSKKQNIKTLECDIFSNNKIAIGVKKVFVYDKGFFIIDWLRKFYDKKAERIAFLRLQGTDMQHQNGIFFTSQPSENDVVKHLTTNITKNNVIEMCMYLSVRQCIEATWLNDRDQFLFPNDGWKTDTEFQNDCLAFALFHGQNKISVKGGTNHFIPFTEQEVDAQERFESSFIADFISGKIKKEISGEIFSQEKKEEKVKLVFSAEAKAVFEAGRLLWKYYHQCLNNTNTFLNTKPNANASLYDIREYFQGRNATGKMKHKSEDEEYTKLIADLRDSLKLLALKIEPKVYEYGFLKR